MPWQSASPPSPTEAASLQACTALSHINLGTPEPDAAHPNRCLPDCCLLEAGIVALALPTDFNRIGSTVCASRQQLQTVDPSQTEDHGVRSLPQVYLSTGGFHSCFTWRDALLQVARNFEQYANKEKAKHGEGHMPLTNVGSSTSPNGTEFCRPMPVIYGEKTF